MNVSSLFTDSGLKGLPHLKDGAQSTHYELKRISKETYSNITYDPAGKYFLLVENFEIRKIDAAGKEVFKLANSGMYQPRFSAYVFDSSGVYDFSAPHIEKQQFSQILNLDQKLKEEEWQKTFDGLYQRADVALFGYTDLYAPANPIFLRVNQQWILLLTREYEPRLQELGYRTGIKFKGYPAKYQHLYLLKNTQSQVYSDFDGTSDSYLETYHETDLPENQVPYPSSHNLKTLFYEKEYVYAELAYTVIPIAWAGQTGISLSFGQEDLRFRCVGIKKVGLFNKVDPFLNWFWVPEQFLPHTHVSFLKYSFPSNDKASENNGLYLLRKISRK